MLGVVNDQIGRADGRSVLDELCRGSAKAHDWLDRHGVPEFFFELLRPQPVLARSLQVSGRSLLLRRQVLPVADHPPAHSLQLLCRPGLPGAPHSVPLLPAHLVERLGGPSAQVNRLRSDLSITINQVPLGEHHPRTQPHQLPQYALSAHAFSSFDCQSERPAIVGRMRRAAPDGRDQTGVKHPRHRHKTQLFGRPPDVLIAHPRQGLSSARQDMLRPGAPERNPRPDKTRYQGKRQRAHAQST